ncbi:methyltransferase domain-containing protein [Amycolatopsis ruanii]|uniref:methyltransferase domain-containing protein n=1 Tax=Amycolatopsis ruanii TaxID=944491 RepID=UPI000E22B814|nr:methyltransferase domain-containing protein [Amycolatopsis ruanii]
MTASVDTQALETQVKRMYEQVATEPGAGFHFELGRGVAIRAGYDPAMLDAIPAPAVESFAGVGFFFDLAALAPGETVVDLGSGSGMDAFYAAARTGPAGHVTGVDFTPAQLAKARRLAAGTGAPTLEFVDARIEHLPLADGSADCVISNGVINLCPDKAAVFAEAARVLRPGGRLAVADIVSEQPLPESVVCNADLWASCIGGAAPQDHYRAAITAAGLIVHCVRDNDYAFISDRARTASASYGVHSVSVLATKPRR